MTTPNALYVVRNMSDYPHAPKPNRKEQRLLDDNPHLCSACQFAEATGYAVYTVRQMCKNGTLLAVRIHTGARAGYFWLIPKSLIPAWKERRHENSTVKWLKKKLIKEGRLTDEYV